PTSSSSSSSSPSGRTARTPSDRIRKTMKKTLSLLFALALPLALPAEARKVKVVSSLQDFASLAESVGGDRVETFSLAKGHQVTRAMGDVHPFGNPHFWLDPANGRVIARAIAARLTQLDPPGREAYEKNLAAFEARLEASEKRWAAKLAPFVNTKIVTYHNSW